MKFTRDILLIDMQTTGQDTDKDFPLQLSAVLLDKDNLLEKANFNSYIRHSYSQSTNDRIVQTLKINKEEWMKAPTLKTVITAFKEKFPYNSTLASHNIINVKFLEESFKRVKIPYEYDYHVLELWTLGYFYLCKQNIKKIPTAQTIGSYLKLQKDDDNNSLTNCRFLAEVLRKLSKAL